ncbi:Putative lipoprotein [Salmonella enterica subsp. enterica serovar Montevideo str. S5-403]|uniref:Putative lipoprotein n=1 Tax=Salmonella enterica subsp. enterica serovar Montevideo str. S5-403 TaxID=913242 RepID=G5Q5F9_SALMO|nr:Putative lipoprotein [Salmonella enterica subsp. enterica serovar Montevideo str. S5-403]
MKTFSLVALILLLCSCSAPHHDSTQAVKQFYTSWMTTFTNDVNTPDDTTALMQRYGTVPSGEPPATLRC